MFGPKPDKASLRNEPIITVDDLHHSYGDGDAMIEVLHGINAEFYRGEIVIIMGPSGSGKSTLLKIIGGQLSVQQGSVKVAGHELYGAKQREMVDVRRRIGFIFQSHHLLRSLTALQNVQMPLAFDAGETPESSQQHAVSMLEHVGLRDHAHKTPDHLSGGQKQRVAIARALIRRPQIILADEPTASLDGKTGREVVDLIQHLAKEVGCAILLVTHDTRIVDIADRLIHLEDGRLVGPPEDAPKGVAKTRPDTKA